MEIICAGYWKTGSKSSTAALRQLGFSVADAIETNLFLTEVWLDFLEEKGSIDSVIDCYKKNGFQANQVGFSTYFKIYLKNHQVKNLHNLCGTLQKNTQMRFFRTIQEIFYGKTFTKPLPTLRLFLLYVIMMRSGGIAL